MMGRIRQSKPELTGAEQRVAAWILAQPHSAVRASLAHVAAEAGASEPTVIRFCRSLGCDGFRDFKVRLAQDLASTRNYIHHDVGDADRPPEVIAKITERTVHVLTGTRDNLSPDAIGAASRAISRSRQIQFAGIGASGIVALDAQHKYFRLGIPCVALSDAPTIRQSAAIVHPEDCVVAISNSGLSPELLRACEDIARSQATLITITAPASPLAQLADIAVDVDTQEDGNVYTPTNSRLAHLLVLDILQVAVALELGNAAAENLRRTNEVLAESKRRDAAQESF